MWMGSNVKSVKRRKEDHTLRVKCKRLRRKKAWGHLQRPWFGPSSLSWFLRWAIRIMSDPCFLLRARVLLAKPLGPIPRSLGLSVLAGFFQHQRIVVQHDRQ